MISQPDLVVAISKAVAKGGNNNVTVRQLNAMVSAANIVINALSTADIPAVPGQGLTAWLASDDTGCSSKFMAGVIWGFHAPYAHPHDPADFGRCYRMLRAVPGTSEKLYLVGEKSQYWWLLVNEWPQLERLYEEQIANESKKKKKYPLYERMNELQKLAREQEKESSHA